jgi:hypothetical protein
MLYINAELVNTKNTSKDYVHADIVKDFHKTVKDAIEQYGEYLVVQTKRRPYLDPQTKYPILPATRGLLLRTTKVDEGGNTQEMIWSEHFLEKNQITGQLSVKEPDMLITRGEKVINIKRSPDLVYYILKCGRVGRTEAEGKKFHIKDDTAKSKASVAKRQAEVKVAYLIFTALQEPNIRTLSKSWGLSDVDVKDIDVLREELYGKVTMEEEAKKGGPAGHRGFKEFVEASQINFVDKVRALCNDAETAGYLVYDNDERKWVINYNDGGVPYVIKEMSGEEAGAPMDSLVKYLLDEQDKRRLIEKVMARSLDRPEDYNPSPTAEGAPELTIEMVQEEANITILKKWLRQRTDEKLPRNLTAAQTREKLLQIIVAEATPE